MNKINILKFVPTPDDLNKCWRDINTVKIMDFIIQVRLVLDSYEKNDLNYNFIAPDIYGGHPLLDTLELNVSRFMKIADMSLAGSLAVFGHSAGYIVGNKA